MTTEAYSEPVAALLTLGRPDRGKEVDFQDYGITQEHAPELIHLHHAGLSVHGQAVAE